MSSQSGTSVRLQIGHVLFMDLVGYSKLLLDEQRQYMEQLTEIVRGTEQARMAKEAGKLIRLPVGDGMALVFFDSPEAPVRCAMEISRKLKEYRQLKLRMGIQKAFEKARPAFEAAVKEAPGSAEQHASLGWLYALMGRKNDVIAEGKRAVELKPESKDAVDGSLEISLAMGPDSGRSAL